MGVGATVKSSIVALARALEFQTSWSCKFIFLVEDWQKCKILFKCQKFGWKYISLSKIVCFRPNSFME